MLSDARDVVKVSVVVVVNVIVVVDVVVVGAHRIRCVSPQQALP